LYQHLLDLRHELSQFVEIYDPSFDDIDRSTLLLFESPKFKIITENELCARSLARERADRVTLVYMPHMDKHFYNNLLGANWSQQGLKSMIILGNSFGEMIDTEIARSRRQRELHYINTLVNNFESNGSDNLHRPAKNKGEKALIETKIDDSSFEHSDVFNNLSFHSVCDIWVQENSPKISLHRLKSWQPSDSS